MNNSFWLVKLSINYLENKSKEFYFRDSACQSFSWGFSLAKMGKSRSPRKIIKSHELQLLVFLSW